jgi:hypothetical protein
MKTIVENVEFKGIPLAKVQIHLVSVTVKDDNSAKTYHKVSNVRMIDGEEVIEFLSSYNLPFTYEGRSVMQEAMNAILAYLADPNT